MVCKVTLGNLHTSTTISLKGGFQRLFHNPYELPSLFSSALSFLPLPSARTPSEERGGGAAGRSQNLTDGEHTDGQRPPQHTRATSGHPGGATKWRPRAERMRTLSTSGSGGVSAPRWRRPRAAVGRRGRSSAQRRWARRPWSRRRWTRRRRTRRCSGPS